MIRLTRAAAALSATPRDLAVARDAWQRVHHLTIPDLVDPDLFATLARALDDTPFAERVHQGIGAELCAQGGAALALLQFLANDPGLFQIVRDLTGAGPLGCFEGRIYRVAPGGPHHDAWHDDASRTRSVALSINLGAAPYQGGVLQIRERDADTLLAEVENTRPGGAVLFGIAPHLQHRITAVTGSVPKLAYTGWFREQPDYRDVFAGRASF